MMYLPESTSKWQPEISNAIGPVQAITDNPYGMLFIFVPDYKMLLDANDPDLDQQIMIAIDALARIYPHQMIGVCGWEPTDDACPKTLKYLNQAGFVKATIMGIGSDGMREFKLEDS